jgi:ABC-type Fe3+/spermidine/putrescine transport system ATPase subunit
MIRVEGLTILFESFKIRDLHIVIEEKEIHSLLGPTGCGKTLILESIMGLHKPSAGKIWIGEREVQSLPPEQREISYVPQDLALFPHLRVRENILYGIKARNLDERLFREHIQLLIQVMKVEHLLERYPANLSGGEKKRVALLRALVPRPKLLLLDEPLSGLDPSIKAEIQELLKTLHSTFHPTILCVTHDFEEAYSLSDRITIFMEGKVEQVGKKDDIFLRPQSKSVAQFLGAKNLYRANLLKEDRVLQRWALEVNGLGFSAPMRSYPGTVESGKEVDLYIRPEEVMIIREGKPVKESLKHNIVPGKVVDIADRRRYHMVSVQTAEGEVQIEISIPNYAFRNLDLSVGKIIRVALREESFWIMQ